MGHQRSEAWGKRIERWRRSGLTAAQFGAREGVNPHTLAFWKWKYPGRPEKTVFSEEVILAVEFIMWQLDPPGTKPIMLPPMPLEGYVPQPSVRAKGEVEVEQ